ncbi:MAG: hypothetical protein WDM86_08600 [Rhizomicrobium sp.]
MADDVIIGELVEIFGRDARFYRRNHQVQDFRRQPSGAAHALEIGGVMQRHGKMGAAGGFEGFGVGHEGHCCNSVYSVA